MNALVQPADADLVPATRPAAGLAALTRADRSRPSLHVLMLHDLICPWSYIGAQRLVRALASKQDVDWTVDWQPFLLSPDLPRGGMAYTEYHRQKSGHPDRLRRLEQAITTMGRADDIEFAFRRIERVPCTVTAHQTIGWAAAQGADAARLARLVLSIFAAHFGGARDISLPGTLTALADAQGYDADALRGALIDGRAGAEMVRAGSRAHQDLGSHGIPCIVTDDGFALAGAQEQVAIERLIDVALTPVQRAVQPLADSACRIA